MVLCEMLNPKTYLKCTMEKNHWTSYHEHSNEQTNFVERWER